MKTTLEAMIVPVGEKPYLKTLEADENGSFLRALQDGLATLSWTVS